MHITISSTLDEKRRWIFSKTNLTLYVAPTIEVKGFIIQLNILGLMDRIFKRRIILSVALIISVKNTVIINPQIPNLGIKNITRITDSDESIMFTIIEYTC